MTKRIARTRKEIGLTIEAYDELLERQGGHCALCPTKPQKRRLDTDHDHKTGAVRGLLCHRCNRALPAWISVRWLAAALTYLVRHEQGRKLA